MYCCIASRKWRGDSKPGLIGFEGWPFLYFLNVMLDKCSISRPSVLSLRAPSSALCCYAFCFEKSTQLKGVSCGLVDMFEPICTQ